MSGVFEGAIKLGVLSDVDGIGVDVRFVNISGTDVEVSQVLFEVRCDRKEQSYGSFFGHEYRGSGLVVLKMRQHFVPWDRATGFAIEAQCR